MPVEDHDELTGHRTTGHEWNGITELNTRVPRAVWWAIGITHLWALAVWLLLPSWPLLNTYTHGLLGIDQRELVAGDLAAGQRYRAHWVARFEGDTLPEIRDDASLMEIVRGAAPALWQDNCGACHGRTGGGGPGFPNLTDDEWLWGGSDEAVVASILYGVNASHPETRISQMPGFGPDALLTRDQIRTVALHVRSLSGLARPEPSAAAEGQQLFLENCAGCHGEDGTGNDDLGAPDLTDSAWIYGGDPDSLFETIHDGRQGWMPAWEGRLTSAEVKMLSVYLLDVLPEAE
jgi:cytochrome c oxidase cbb3-type subunit 3